MRKTQKTPNHAGINTNENATSTSIFVTDTWTKVNIYTSDLPSSVSLSDYANGYITIGSNGIYIIGFNASGETVGVNKTFEHTVFEVSGSSVSITNITQATPAVVTAAGHGLSNGDKVKISEVAGMTQVNNQIFTVAGVSGDNFNLTTDGDVNVNSSGYTAYSSGGESTLTIAETTCHSHRRHSTGGDIGSFSSSSIVNLTKGDLVELYCKNITDDTNFTFKAINFFIYST